MKGPLAVVAAAAAYVLVVRRWMMRWGATDEERARALPGDEAVQDAEQVTRAITIDAPAAAIWPWIVQMGQNRAGFYTHARLERLFGARIRNVDRIVPEWQTLEVGDLVRTYRRVERSEPLGWFVVRLEPERLLVLRSKHEDWSWTLLLEPIGGERTRLLSRERSARKGVVGTALRRFPYEPAHFAMETGVLHGLKQRAEL
jgi:hypothetical protein